MHHATSVRPSAFRRFALGLVLPVLLVVGVAACGSSGTKTTSSTTPSSGAGSPTAGATITIKDFAFHPQTDTVKPGATITVTNSDSTTHTLTATGSAKGMFDTGNLNQGQSKTITAPSQPGSYPYLCQIHNYMTGTLKVS